MNQGSGMNRGSGMNQLSQHGDAEDSVGRDPELAAEQAHLDHAYRRLAETRDEALKLQSMVEVGKGGTTQARYEREVIIGNIATRLDQLDIGSRSLCFGRIDQSEEIGGASYHIGRVAVSDENKDPLIVDWRAPIAEAFYRATGRDPQGLVRRRHFISRGRELLGLEDEFFGEAAGSNRVMVNGRELRGEGALIAALETSRSGQLSDIVGTIQAEQDEIIRAPLPGVLIVQGGPGTGKTVVALHRAAYLLYSHRFPLEGQGVLVVGPNRLFLGYIEQVLPSLGEAGVEMAVLSDLIPGVRVQGRDSAPSGRIKGDLRMVNLVRRAVADRQRPLSEDLRVGYGRRYLRMTVAESEEIIRQGRRRFRTHNAARSFVVRAVFETLAESHPDGPADPVEVRESLGDQEPIRAALLRMWPMLSPARLLHDLYGSRALIRSAASGRLSDAEREALVRPWETNHNFSKRIWTVDDVPVLDEAFERLGPRPRFKHIDDVRTYGHIVVDEAQDLSPMQLRMLTRRSLNGSMTIVGDIAQSTGAWAHANWSEILEHLPDRRPARRAELTVGYRIPGPTMDLASRVLRVAAPELDPPQAVRSDGDPPRFVSVGDHRADGKTGHQGQNLFEAAVAEAKTEQARLGQGNVALVCATDSYEALAAVLESSGVPYGRARRDGFDHSITLVPVSLVKGLEVDSTIVVEPSDIIEGEPQGARSLYVAVTRSTKRLVIVHAKALPGFLVSDDAETVAASVAEFQGAPTQMSLDELLGDL